LLYGDSVVGAFSFASTSLDFVGLNLFQTITADPRKTPNSPRLSPPYKARQTRQTPAAWNMISYAISSNMIKTYTVRQGTSRLIALVRRTEQSP
jgi:hypothetical protein